jgi:hypothetical protein
MTVSATKAVVLAFLCAASISLAQQRSFDGKWWALTKSDERRGFLAGYLDCYVDDQKHALAFDKSWAEYETAITHLYAAGTTKPVPAVLVSFGKPNRKALARPHEDFGDEWWRQDSHSARIGFVEGYIACRQTEERGPRWSRPTAFYVDKLNDMYNADDRHGLDAPEYSGSIASALLKLADGAGGIR